MDIVEIGGKLAIFFVPFLFALCFHEYAHGLVAKWRGDNTAEQLGRLTLNPMAHADIVGTFILPISAIVFGIPIFFGWAKPVPVNIRNLKNVRTDMFWIAIAGPLSNVLLALVGTVIMMLTVRLGLLGEFAKPVMSMLQMFVLVNLFLALFNLIPLHPLDGGKVLARFLPASVNLKLEQNEQMTSFILLGLMITGAFSVLRVPVFYVFNHLMAFAGAGAFL
ncbi:MAG: Zn-dependent protease [Bdellovibrionales bacterium RIFCSPHIGHO2_01_FULL_40_29]|nr:MAG: Zn-dependent protease [Bdellovibrionales bacterium RIFCSPHIGHO2_01_FULL_40_29]OFZ35607.1 MAG: Zn-dependent protease [Bdellovibrionales bacterium RIFCSPHIGHO2_02_FULL_40_15]